MHIEHEYLSESFSKYHVRDAPFYKVFHHFKKPDTGDFHDHPSPMEIRIEKGGYIEDQLIIAEDGTCVGGRRIVRKPGDIFTIEAGTVHKIVELLEGECWTSMTPGLHEREWGFYRVEDGKVLHRFWNSEEWNTHPPFPDTIRLETM